MSRLSAVTLSIVLFAGTASAGDVAPVLESMSAVLDAAYEIERYTLRHGRLPAATSPAELSQALLGTDGMAEFLVDAWGTPLHIESNPDSNRYVVVSAGADRQFARATWTARAETRDAAEDIVIRNGELLRWPEAWALARFQAEGGDAARSLGESLETSRAARTLADMMVIRTAIEQYAAEHGALPAGLAALTPPLPRNDAWGRPFSVTIDRAARTYRIVSAGADGTFDETRWSEPGETLDYARDAVLRNGELTASWNTRAPGRTLGAAYSTFMLFKTKLASLRILGEEERRKLRLEGLAKDRDAAAERQDFFTAMNFYEEAEKLGVRNSERLQSWALSFTLNTPPPPGQPAPPRLMSDARHRAAAGRIAAALRRALAAASDAERWPLTETLADLERERGDSKAAEQLMEAYAAARPGDPMPRLRQLAAALRDGDTAAVLRLTEAVMTVEPAGYEALYATGLSLYEVVAKSGEGIAADRKRAIAVHARRLLERAAALDPEAMEPLVYLSLTLRQLALLERDPAIAAKLVEEADALRGRAVEIGKRRRAGQ